jgi:hypothetical protein
MDAVDTESPNAEPGAWLTAERERTGWSLVQAADRLHLDVATVKALESGHYEALGAAVYARGHLRRYAELLGLSAHDVEQAFLRLNPARSAPDLRHGAGVLQKSDVGVSALRTRTTAIGAAVVVVGALIWWAVHLPHARGVVTAAGTPEPAAAPATAAPPRTPAPAAPAPPAVTTAATGPTVAVSGLLNGPAPPSMLLGDASSATAGLGVVGWGALADSANLRFPLISGGGVYEVQEPHPARGAATTTRAPTRAPRP